MLQFDRHFVNGSKLIRGSHSKPPTDFVSRNKRAIRDKSRSQAATRNAASTTTATTTDQRLKGRPRSRKALVERQQAERKRETREASGSGGNRAREGVGSDTVVISKSYLDELMRMSVTVHNEASDNRGSHSNQNIPKDRNEFRREGNGGHIDVDASEVPGLGSASATKHVSATSSRPTEHAQISATAQHRYQGHTPRHAPQQANNYEGLSPREKWLQELAAQVKEQKAKKERNRLQEQRSTVEEYFPFGRPGGGAPIRSQSGALLTDYRSRTRAQDQGGVATQGHLESRRVGDIQPHQEQAYLRAQREASNRDGGYVPGHTATNAYTGNVAANTGVDSGDVMMMSPRRGEAVPQQYNDVYSTTPRFARGAGPHVDQYMKREMDEKRRKQMENMEFVRQQVAEKERAKLEEKLRREREDALEEARLARERDRMKADFEREKERARRKELEAHQRQALLQQRIQEAEESARLAKLEARGVLVNATNHHHHPTVSFDEYTTVARSTESNFLGEGVYSSLSKSNLRSPSMLQLANATNEAGHHGDGNAPPTQRGGAIGARKGRVIGRSKVPEREEGDRKEVVRRNSRIPVMQQSTASKAATAKVSKAGAVGSKVQSSKVNGHAIARSINRVSTKRGREVGVRQVKGRVVGSRTAETGGGAMERSYSPPVPALAKKMKQQQSLPKKDARQHTQRITTTNENVNFIRSSSPPVPAVAKKLRNGGQFESEEHVSEYTRVASPPVPALTKTMRNHGQVESEFVHVPPPPTTTVTQPSYERTSSPPVPAVAKRLRDTGEAMASDKNHTGDMKRERSYDRASSPPVPTVAKRLQQNELSKGSIVPGKGQSTVVIRNGNSEVIEKLNSDMKLNFSPSRMILANDSDISINRPPSCKPESKPISPVATNATLPAIPMATADHHRGNQGGMVHLPPASNRQRLILQQLTMLKEGILTQQNDIDHRVQNILTRNRQCNF